MDLSGRQLTRRSPLFCLPSAFTRPSPEMLDWLAALPLPETPRQRAWVLARAVHSRLTYAPGATGVATTAAQAFHNGRGVFLGSARQEQQVFMRVSQQSL